MGIQIMVTTGGTSLKDDIMRLYNPVHVLVGTPGRILDLTNKGVCKLNNCTTLVMDEVRRHGSHLEQVVSAALLGKRRPALKCFLSQICPAIACCWSSGHELLRGSRE